MGDRGGESGPGARLMEPEWVNSLMEQCNRKSVPFFFKQWGGVRKKQTGRELNGRTFDEFPQLCRSEFPPRATRMQVLRSTESQVLNLLGYAENIGQLRVVNLE